MGEVFGKAKKSREFLLYVIPPLLTILSGLAVSLGLEVKFVWIPSLVLLVWPAYLLIARFPTRNPELSFLQTVRATIYFVDLLILLPANGILITPSNPITFLYTMPVAGGAAIVDLVIWQSAYRDQMAVFSIQERRLFRDLILKTAGAPIWLSIAIVQAELTISQTPLLALSSAAFAFVFGYQAYRREKSSAKLAEELADQLKKVKWQNKLTIRKRHYRKPSHTSKEK